MHRRSHPCRRIYSRRDAGILRRCRHCLRKSVCPRTLPVHEKHFNIVAVASPSEDSGVSVPRLGEWKRTAFSSHFSTFYSDRYLTTSRVKSIHDALAGIPYEHIIILANTEEYGGGGIYNSYTLTTAHHPMFRPVVVHEFGHSLADWPMNTSTTMT